MRTSRGRMRALESSFHGMGPVLWFPALLSPPVRSPAISRSAVQRRDQLRRPLAPSPRPDHVRISKAPSHESYAVSGATPFLGYTIEPAGCSLAGPGALALLKIDPPERWRSVQCCIDENIRKY